MMQATQHGIALQQEARDLAQMDKEAYTPAARRAVLAEARKQLKRTRAQLDEVVATVKLTNDKISVLEVDISTLERTIQDEA